MNENECMMIEERSAWKCMCDEWWRDSRDFGLYEWINECGWWKSVRWLIENYKNWRMNENERVMNKEEGVKYLIKMNKWMNVVDESQSDD